MEKLVLNFLVASAPQFFADNIELIAGIAGSLAILGVLAKKNLFLKFFKKKISKKLPLGGENQLAALLLCIFFGGLGIHRFYLGYIWQGIVQLLTGGGCGIWALIDLIRIITGDLQPKNGSYSKTL